MATVELTSDADKVLRALDAIGKRMESLDGQMRHRVKKGADETNTSMGQAFDVKRLVAFAGGFVGIHQAMRMVTNAYDVWLTKTREHSKAAKDAVDQYVALASLMEGGTKRQAVLKTHELAMQYLPPQERGQAWNIVQGLASQIQSQQGVSQQEAYQQGIETAAVIFRATRFDVPIELAAEMETLGMAGGAGPATSIRRAFVAGEASGRKPGTLVRAAAGLQFFEDPVMALAMAAKISETVSETKLETYLKSAGIGLSKTSAEGFQKTLATLGVADASQYEKAVALKKAGLVTPEQLQLAGLTEQRQAQGVAAVVKNIQAVMPIYRQIEEMAVPGLFRRKMKEVAKELPEAGLKWLSDAIESHTQGLLEFGPGATAAQRQEVAERRRAFYYRREGFEMTPMGTSLIDEQSRVSPFRHWLSVFGLLGAELFTLVQPKGMEAPARATTRLAAERAVAGAALDSDLLPGKPTGMGLLESVTLGLAELNRERQAQMGIVDDLKAATKNLNQASENLSRATVGGKNLAPAAARQPYSGGGGAEW